MDGSTKGLGAVLLQKGRQWKKSIAVVSPQLQCLLLWLANYDVELIYLKGKQKVIANALSQASPLEPEPEDKDNFDVFPVHHIPSEISATGSSLETIRVATAADPVHSQFKHHIGHGWPEAKRDIPESM